MATSWPNFFEQVELDGFSSDYEAFKQKQSGVLGWFKYKLPFTETRKQELGHRDADNDRGAEILANSLRFTDVYRLESPMPRVQMNSRSSKNVLSGPPNALPAYRLYSIHQNTEKEQQ